MIATRETPEEIDVLIAEATKPSVIELTNEYFSSEEQEAAVSRIVKQASHPSEAFQAMRKACWYSIGVMASIGLGAAKCQPVHAALALAEREHPSKEEE